MVRPAATGLATAFFRLHVLDALAARGPARPAALLAAAAEERLPLATGAFGRTLQSLIEGGHVVSADAGTVGITEAGRSEYAAERERWASVIPAVRRIVGEPEPEPAPPTVAEPSLDYRAARAQETYLDRVLMTALRERAALARDGGTAFALALGRLDLAHPLAATRRAMLHRAVRATLGGARALLGSDADAYRWGEAGIAVLAPLAGDPARGERVAALLELRLDELARAMCATVRSFAGARWRARAASAAWSAAAPTALALLDRVTAALDPADARERVA